MVGDPTWVTHGTRRWSSPDPSPDGERVAFYSLTVPQGDVYVMGADGTDLRQLTGDAAIDRVPRWSPDGEWLTFFSDRAGPAHNWKVRVDGSELTRIGDVSGGVTVWSPDGARMMVTPATVDATSAVVFHPADPSDADTLPTPPADVTPFAANDWSPDGRAVAGDIGFTDTGIAVYSFRTNEYRRLTDFGQWPVWLPDGRHLLFVSGGEAFYVVDSQSGDVGEVFRSDSDVIGPPRLTRDGRRMYYSRRSSEADLWLVSFR